MSKVKLYRFSMYDIDSDEWRQSRRHGTEETIKGIPGALISDNSTEVEESEVRWWDGHEGLTEVGWFPRSPHTMR